MKLVGRQIELAIDTILITRLRVSFRVSKTLKPEPNTAEIRVWNLTDAQREQITHVKTPAVRLSAGYPDAMNQFFFGTLIHTYTTIEGANIITNLDTGDGAEEYKKARISISLGAKTRTSDAIRAIAKALGVKAGNVEAAAKAIDGGLKANIYASGVSLTGSAARAMSSLCLSAGLEWSIQDGQLQIIDRTKALEKIAIKLASGHDGKPNTGLIGTPTISNKGVVTGTCLMISDMYPGRSIEIDSRFVKGQYRLESCEYVGDTYSDDWYINFEAKDIARIGKPE